MKSIVGVANLVFNHIRNCPLAILNTEQFRRQLFVSLEELRGNYSDEEYQLLAAQLGGYSVNFVPSACCNILASSECALYAFDNFDGVYFVSNLLTRDQCNWLLYETLISYINPPSNSNLLVNDPSLEGPIWPGKIFSKFKWATVGHLYDWGKRQFDGYVPFPKLLKRLVDYVNDQLKDLYLPFEANAAIINCYSGSYFLRLHKDDAEVTNDAILNFSLGEPAIFCVGGVDQSTIPLSMVLDSASLVIMSGNSRRCLHGIAKLLHYVKPSESCSNRPKVINRNNEELESLPRLEPVYGRPRLLRSLVQCPDELFDGVEKNISDEHLHLMQGIRTSISIRRAV